MKTRHRRHAARYIVTKCKICGDSWGVPVDDIPPDGYVCRRCLPRIRSRVEITGKRIRRRYRTCPICGAALDASEKCDCEKTG